MLFNCNQIKIENNHLSRNIFISIILNSSVYYLFINV